MTLNSLNSLRQAADPAFAPAKPIKAKTAPFSLRLSTEERADLDARAGTMPLGAYIKSELFSGRSRARRRSVASAVDQRSLARALALLGQSRISSNLNQIAKAANMGTLPITPDVEDDLKEACSHVSEIRNALVHALGLNSGGRA